MSLNSPRPLRFPHDLSVACSDKILMTINRPTNFQQTMELSLADFSRGGQQTDVSLVGDDGDLVKVHGFLLSAASPFLREVLSTTFSPNLEYVVILPGVNGSVISCLAQLLYGLTVVASAESLEQVSGLVEVLGIRLDLASQPALLTEQSHQAESMESQEAELEMAEDAGGEREGEGESCVAMLKYDDKNNIPTSEPGTEMTVETVGEVGELPLCCYHCSLPFSSFDSLNSHICTKAGTGRRHHRCNQCGAVLSSMWRLRQHLATHSVSWGRGKTDHMYGRSSRRLQTNTRRHQAGDHGYAGAKQPPGTDHRYHHPPQSSPPAPPAPPTPPTPPTSRVHSEHSYGTKRDSSPEGSEGRVEMDYHRSDHIYSADRDNEETDTDHEVGDPDTPHGQDHQYFSSPERERSSPRFRKLLPKNSAVTEPLDPLALSIGKFSCSSCGKGFPQAYRLRRHVREVHDKEKMYECDECEKKFFKTNSLTRHKISVHEKIRPFSCPNCQSKFKDKSALKYHTKKNVCQT